MTRTLSLFLFLLALAGCGGTRPAAERQSFLIQAERVGAAREPIGGSLRVGRVTVAAPFSERPFIYRRDDVRYETDFYNQFAADPAEMVTEAVGGWLRQSGLFRQVMEPEAVAAADFRLEANISAFYVDFQESVPAALLHIHWQMVRESDGASLLDLDCRQRVALEERSPAGTARAYREALEQALAKLETALAGSSV